MKRVNRIMKQNIPFLLELSGSVNLQMLIIQCPLTLLLQQATSPHTRTIS